ncbi:hypothetical protein FB451DRAFT_1204285 [Mycena latifolia]|nr:hypothetical protein FB451DRAFT_1204285 [Mycena latifolia]
MGGTLSTQSKTASVPEPQVVPTDDILFTPPYFPPVAADILMIESVTSMGGPSFICALLYSPHLNAGGIAIDGYGRISTVPANRWEEMESLVRKAKEVWTELGNRSSWSRPTLGSCPTDAYYDLGPSENVETLSTFHQTSHCVSAENLAFEGTSITISVPKRSAILTLKRMEDGTYEKTTVKEIPEPITTLQSALGKLLIELFPSSSGDFSPAPEEIEAQAMLTTVKGMCSAIRHAEQLKLFFRTAKKQNSWFNWR